MNYTLNKKYSSFSTFLIEIQNYFKKNNTTIYKARNELKIISYKNTSTVVKSFKVPNILDKFGTISDIN